MSWQSGRERVSVLAALAIQKESVSRKLTELREEHADPQTGKPLSQERAAARVGATSRTWQRWESGETVPYPRNLEAIADEFGFDVGDFFDGDAEVVPTSRARTTQLDRIETQLRRNAERMELVIGTLNGEVAELKRQISEIRELAMERVGEDVVTAGTSGEPDATGEEAQRKDRRQ